MSKNKGFWAYFRIDFTSIQGRATLIFLTVLLGGLGFFIFHTYTWQQVSKDRQDLIDVVYPIEFYSLELFNKVQETQVNLHQYMLLKDKKHKDANRRIWLVEVAAYKDSLYYYVNKSQNQEAKVAYVTITKHLAALRQLQERSSIAYTTVKDDKLWRKIMEEDLEFEIEKIQQAIDQLIIIEKERKKILEEEYASQISRYQWFVLGVLFTGFLSVYIIGAVILRRVIKGLFTIREHLQTLGKGDLPEALVLGRDEFRGIEKDINQLTEKLESIKIYASSVGEGEFNTDLLALEKESELGRTLFLMGKNLKEIYEDDRQRSWVSEGLAKFADILRTHSDTIEGLCREVVNQLVKHLGVLQGGFFVVRTSPSGERYFYLQATYAYGKEKFLKKEVPIYEGLLGRVYQEKEVVHLKEVPENYMHITSGLGETPPNTLLILPLEYEHQIEGAIELASLRDFAPYELRFLNQLSEIVASTLSAAINSQRNRELLAEAQGMAENFKAQERELRQKTAALDKVNRESQLRLMKVESEQQKFKAILDTTVDAVIITDAKGLVEFFNRAAENIFEYKEKEILGKNVAILMPSPYSQEHDAYMKRYIETQEAHVIGKGRQVTGLTKNGRQIQLELALSDVNVGQNHWFTAVIRKI